MEDARDVELALEIHNRLNNKIGLTENAIITENIDEDDYEPRTLVDNTLELIDPTPNIHTLFVQFNAKYFWNRLLPVEVKWSNRMTTCAGVCSFHPRNYECIITLSAPLLKLRPRKDLVETLLHEMIHAYLFLTHNNRDRDGHGPEFHKHMHRINKETGTQITVYHNFHDEVKLYQQHWWCCNGPCQKKAPYFGTVRRAMNRAPGPNDTWWKMHQQTCGGQFIKVREPAKKPAKNKKVTKESDKKVSTVPKFKDISDWLTKIDKTKASKTTSKADLPTKTTTAKPAASESTKNSIPTTNKSSSVTKLGNTSNNIHGWGIGGPSGSAPVPSTSKAGLKSPKFHATGVLGGSRSGRSNLLDKFSSCKNSGLTKSMKGSGSLGAGQSLGRDTAVDVKDASYKRKSDDFGVTGTKIPKIEEANCPVCHESVIISVLNDHLDECLIFESTSDTNQSSPKLPETPNDRRNDFPKASSISSPIIISDSSGSEDIQSPLVSKKRPTCLICDEFIDPGVTVSEHLETCIQAAFIDDFIPEFEDNNKNSDGDKSSEKNFPCPNCMKIVHEDLMNEHLVICLNNDSTAE